MPPFNTSSGSKTTYSSLKYCTATVRPTYSSKSSADVDVNGIGAKTVDSLVLHHLHGERSGRTEGPKKERSNNSSKSSQSTQAGCIERSSHTAQSSQSPKSLRGTQSGHSTQSSRSIRTAQISMSSHSSNSSRNSTYSGGKVLVNSSARSTSSSGGGSVDNGAMRAKCAVEKVWDCGLREKEC
ncbi:hypothetical protein K470DRAFT_262012 [Piedraia hortae CBS 480.64]|uniref:Uncharacterized protein n=1 Tax=Piedraia hortae CBS 480.64 TaxID=1314780 RepID=A0A6A7C7S8_9PEZI|nr:hypothetical protein K470DRAFT_262012 [Piedraia hortae CBS 480.64]